MLPKFKTSILKLHFTWVPYDNSRTPTYYWLIAVPREEPHLPAPRAASVNLILSISILGMHGLYHPGYYVKLFQQHW
jgi:hypothetical protein